MSSTADLIDDNSSSAEKPSRRLVSRFLQDSSNLWAENRILKFTSVACLVSVLLMSIVVAGQANRVRTIVVPFGGNSGDLLIVGNEPSVEYLGSIARNVVQLTGTYTAATAEHQFNEVLKFVHPSVYEATRADWKKLVASLRDYRDVSFATYVLPQKPIEVSGSKIRVPAQRSRYLGGKSSTEVGTVVIDYVVENGRWWMTSVEFVGPGSRGATDG
ncbi:MAG: TraE/TraK family type IV conjugative transfer system protein [Pseudomonadota bacterium]